MDNDFWNDFDWADMALKVVVALAILAITWILARVVKAAFAKLVERVSFLKKAGTDGKSFGESLGQIASLLVWLFGLVAILQVFDLDQVLSPIRDLLGGILGYLPNLIGAAFLFFVGALIAKIVREIVQTALSSVDIGSWFDRGTTAASQATGTSATSSGSTTSASDETTARMSSPTDASADAGRSSTGGFDNASLARTVATIVYALIMIVVTIAALQILQIDAISDPAEQMLSGIFDAIPLIIAALLILGIGVLIARFAGGLLRQVLEGFGTDRALAEMNVNPRGTTASAVIARVAQVAIVLFFAVMAANVLEFPQVTELLQQVLELGGRVLFGGAIIAVGFFVAKLLADMTGGGLATQVVRYATLVLFVAMGLKSMGIADSIIELGFGALVVGGAAAAALAFGLGGRDAAARQLERVQSRAQSGSGTAPVDSGTTASGTTPGTGGSGASGTTGAGGPTGDPLI